MELEALRDPDAAADASDCANWLKSCSQTRHNRFGRFGASVRVVKQADGTWSLNGAVCTAPQPPAVGVADVRREVTRLVPTASIGVAPQGWTLVNIETVIWLNAPRHRTLAPVTILGHQVSIDLTFDHATLDFGDGSGATWSSPGKAYDNAEDPCATKRCPDYAGHVYRDTGTMAVHATVAWHATFTVDGGNRVAIPGTVSGPTAQTEIPVKQARGELIHDPGN